MSKTPQELGFEWEKLWKERVQGDLQPGSGNKFYAKLDVRSERITWSCKYTTKDSFSVNSAIISENDRGTIAPGGNGSIPATAIRLGTIGDFVVLRADDFIDLMTKPPLLAADKAANRRAEAKVPELLK